MDQKTETGLQYIYENRARFIEDLLDMTAIEAPSHHEQARAEELCRRFRDAGLADVHIDSVGNAIGFHYGRERDTFVLLEAHMDTVFPFGTVTERPTVGPDGVIRCPGVSDNTAGLVNLVHVARTITSLDIETKYTLVFAGTVNEEGQGNDGIKGLLDTFGDRLKYSITVDGCEYQDIVYLATAIRAKRYVIRGMGGHPYSEYGVIPQALRVASEIAGRITEIRVPAEPKTTVVVSNIHAGDPAVTNAIPETAELTIDFRSNSQKWMKHLDETIEMIVRSSVEAEACKWTLSEKEIRLDYDEEVLLDVPGGEQPADMPLVKMLEESILAVGGTPYFAKGGCCNSNVSIARGIPTVAMGTSNLELGEHTLDEFMPTDHIYKCTQEIFLMALKAGGYAGE